MENVILLDWGAFTLLLLVIMRMTGLIGLNPIFSREGVPATVKTGLILVLSFIVFSIEGGRVTIPNTSLELIVMFLKEFLLGVVLSMVMNICFMVPAVAGSAIDTQMGFSMAQVYDPGSGATLTVSATYLNTLMLLVFFAANGHHTLLRILLTTGDIVPYGSATAAISGDLLIHMTTLFADCMVLALKLTMPILAAELLGQVGMGVLMKAIPQINVFVINIDLKVLIGLALMYILLPDMSVFLLDLEREMLAELQYAMLLFARG